MLSNEVYYGLPFYVHRMQYEFIYFQMIHGGCSSRNPYGHERAKIVLELRFANFQAKLWL